MLWLLLVAAQKAAETDPLSLANLMKVYGPLGVLAALGFHLFLRERKAIEKERDKLIEHLQKSVDRQVEDTAAKIKLRDTLGELTKLLDKALAELKAGRDRDIAARLEEISEKIILPKGYDPGKNQGK